MEESKHGKIGLWFSSCYPDGSGPKTIFTSSSCTLCEPAHLSELVEQSTKAQGTKLYLKERWKLTWSPLFLMFFGGSHNTLHNFTYRFQKGGKAWPVFSIHSCCPTLMVYFSPQVLKQLFCCFPVISIMLSNSWTVHIVRITQAQTLVLHKFPKCFQSK